MDDTLSPVAIPNPEDPEKNKGKGPVINNWHINGGLLAIQTWLKENSPNWITVHEPTVDGVHRYFRMSYAFSDFNDFTAKYKTLVDLSPNLSWDDFDADEKPRWEVSSSGFKRIVRFSESRDLVAASLDWAVDGIYKDLYNAQNLAGLVGKENIWSFANYRLTIGDQSYEELKHYDRSRPDGEKFGKIVVVESATLSLAASFTNTGLLVGIVLSILIIAALGVFLLARKKKARL
jgi:hypothetical protein